MKTYPLLEPSECTDPERYLAEVKFWQLVGTGGSILTPRHGVVDWLATEHNANLQALIDQLSPYFTNFPAHELEVVLLILLTGLHLEDLRRYWKESKKPERWDSPEQADVLSFLRDNLNSKNPAERFADKAKQWTSEKSPEHYIYTGIQLHLDGFAELGADKLVEFSKMFEPSSRELKGLIKFRTAKALAGAGKLSQSDEQYSKLAQTQGGLELAETIRERCNIALQTAWTWPETPKHQDKLRTLVNSCKTALGVRAPTGKSDRFKKVQASLREFSANLSLLRKPVTDWAQKDLREIGNAIKDLTAIEATTGRNRHAHLALLYNRRSDPASAIECLHSVRDQIESNMEKGLSWLVEGQAIRLQESTKLSEKQTVAFRQAEILFKLIPGDRYRRVARGFRVQSDPLASKLDKVGAWAASMLGGNRIVGSFVAQLPSNL